MSNSFAVIRFFKESSEEEREHAEKFMQYQVLPSFLFLCHKDNKSSYWFVFDDLEIWCRWFNVLIRTCAVEK